MPRHPSEYFIKYLLTLPRPEAQDDKWVTMGVEALGFPPPEGTYLSRLREKLYANLPANYEPTNRYNRPSVRFLREEQIWSLHNPDDAVKLAVTILWNFRVRKLVEQLLLGRLEAKDVAKKVNARTGEYQTTASIRAYSHYYWNCSLLKITEWAEFFEQYDSQESSKALAVLHNGPAMALHMTGFQQNLESKNMLKEVQEGMYFDFRDWQSQPRSLDKTKAMTSIARSIANVDVRLSEADTALRDSLRAFEQFRMEHQKQQVPSIEDVAPVGNFSDSGAKLKELPAPKESKQKSN